MLSGAVGGCAPDGPGFFYLISTDPALLVKRNAQTETAELMQKHIE